MIQIPCRLAVLTMRRDTVLDIDLAPLSLSFAYCVLPPRECSRETIKTNTFLKIVFLCRDRRLNSIPAHAIPYIPLPDFLCSAPFL
jgi:hypothetical protein